MAFFRKKTAPPAKPGTTATDAAAAATPVVSLVLADAALRAGETLVRRGIERGLLKGQKAPTGRVIRGRTVTETIIGTVLVHVARRSVPGAIVIGCGMVARSVINHRRARAAKAAETRPDKIGK